MPAYRPRRLRQAPRPPLTIKQILAWADHEFEQKGRWPRTTDLHLLANRNEKWRNIDAALREGRRGLPRGGSLARLLALHRGVRNKSDLPPLNEQQIVRWAKVHYRRTGTWPNAKSGPVIDAPGEKWDNIDMSLWEGLRGLPGGDSIARLLARECGCRYLLGLPRITENQIKAWAKAHFQRTGSWPDLKCGVVVDAPGEKWLNLDRFLRVGGRGLPGGDCLSRLIARCFGVRNQTNIPRLTNGQILAWADAHRARTGRWPVVASGPIVDAPGETWLRVDTALRYGGLRGLEGGTSLPRLLAEHQSARNQAETPRLTTGQILAWADVHYRRTGKWPSQRSGPVLDVEGESWRAIQTALLTGLRGLPRGQSIMRLLAQTGRVQEAFAPAKVARKVSLPLGKRTGR